MLYYHSAKFQSFKISVQKANKQTPQEYIVMKLLFLFSFLSFLKTPVSLGFRFPVIGLLHPDVIEFSAVTCKALGDPAPVYS